ncbi:protein of unknown function [Nitrospira defluvii]|uniref:Uncharacterized protein n=1 Tax=Nitrospira defluvii TaxID=330214 RepID=D8PB88_9BACT|nr:protein of unknown function [Nitrospira defluvii]
MARIAGEGGRLFHALVGQVSEWLLTCQAITGQLGKTRISWDSG